jgi:hypothetical protein
MKESLKREFKIIGAWDKRSKDPNKDFGIHSMEMHFRVIGEKGGCSITIITGWYLDKNRIVQSASDQMLFINQYPWICSFDYHSKKPFYGGQYSVKECELTGGECYCDGTSLNEELRLEFLRDGDKAIWKALELKYEDIFS